MHTLAKRYYPFSQHLQEVFRCKVHKITVDAGFTCPNRDGTLGYGGCIYCNNRGFNANDSHFDVKTQIQQGIRFARRRYKAQKFIAYFQAYTNTYAPPEYLHRLFREALSQEGIVGLSIGTRPDCVDEPVLNLIEDLARENYIWIEYGLQSAHDKTLDLINRGHHLAHFLDAVERTKRRNIRMCVHIILGLPGEGREEMLETARIVSRLGLDGIKIHLMHAIKNTALEQWYYEKKIKMLEMQEYASLVADVLEILPPDMVIQRLTGDAPKEILVAPDWAIRKLEIINLIEQELTRRGSCQGSQYKSF